MSSERTTARSEQQTDQPLQSEVQDRAEPSSPTGGTPPEPASSISQHAAGSEASPVSSFSVGVRTSAAADASVASEGCAPSPGQRDCTGYSYGMYYPCSATAACGRAPWDFREGAIGGWATTPQSPEAESEYSAEADCPRETGAPGATAWPEEEDCAPEAVTVQTYDFSQIPKSVWVVLRDPQGLCEYCLSLENLAYDEEIGVITAAFCESCRIKISKRPENRCTYGHPGCLGQRWVGPLGDVSLRCRGCDQYQRQSRAARKASKRKSSRPLHSKQQPPRGRAGVQA